MRSCLCTAHILILFIQHDVMSVCWCPSSHVGFYRRRVETHPNFTASTGQSDRLVIITVVSYILFKFGMPPQLSWFAVSVLGVLFLLSSEVCFSYVLETSGETLDVFNLSFISVRTSPEFWSPYWWGNTKDSRQYTTGHTHTSRAFNVQVFGLEEEAAETHTDTWRTWKAQSDTWPKRQPLHVEQVPAEFKCFCQDPVNKMGHLMVQEKPQPLRGCTWSLCSEGLDHLLDSVDYSILSFSIIPWLLVQVRGLYSYCLLNPKCNFLYVNREQLKITVS